VSRKKVRRVFTGRPGEYPSETVRIMDYRERMTAHFFPDMIEMFLSDFKLSTVSNQFLYIGRSQLEM
jgi:hypothetical protein